MRLYQELTEMGYSTGWKRCGSLLLAQTRDRLTHLRRMKAHSVTRDIECHIMSAEDIAKMYPYINTKGIQGGLWIPNDGVADPYSVCKVITPYQFHKIESSFYSQSYSFCSLIFLLS